MSLFPIVHQRGELTTIPFPPVTHSVKGLEVCEIWFVMAIILAQGVRHVKFDQIVGRETT